MTGGDTIEIVSLTVFDDKSGTLFREKKKAHSKQHDALSRERKKTAQAPARRPGMSSQQSVLLELETLSLARVSYIVLY
jgi:hypothetical protein